MPDAEGQAPVDAGKAALIGFVVLQVIVIAVWVMATIPVLDANAPFFVPDAQIWSGGAYSDITGNFRSGTEAVMAAPFRPFETLLWATLLMVAAGGTAVATLIMFRASRIWIAVGLAAVSLALGAGGAWFIVTQWSGDTMFAPGGVHVSWLYAITRAFIIQFFIGFALMALATVLVIAGVATKERPFGFHLVALNWVIVAAVWAVAYLTLYVAPSLSGGP